MLEEILKKYIRYGIITSVNKNNTARVQFTDMDGLVSYDLQILVPNAGQNKNQSPPDVGCSALCLMMPTGHSNGFILGCYYDGKKTAPVNSLDQKLHWTFSDGTILEYDTKKHQLLADVKGSITAKATTKSTLNCPNIILTGNVLINGTLQVNIGGTTVASVGAGDLKINGKIETTQDITIKNGKLDVKGDITTQGKVSASGTVHGSNI